MVLPVNADESLTEGKKSEIQKELLNYSKILKTLEGTTGSPNSRFWYQKGVCEYRLKMEKEALKSFEESIAVASDSGNPETNDDALWKVNALFAAIHSYGKLGEKEKIRDKTVELRRFLKEHPLRNEKWVMEKMKKLEISE